MGRVPLPAFPPLSHSPKLRIRKTHLYHEKDRH